MIRFASVVAVGAVVTGVLMPAGAGAQTTNTGAVPAGVFNGISSMAGIAASSPANAWAVGSTALDVLPDGVTVKQRCVIAHWNGRRWRTNVRCPSRAVVFALTVAICRMMTQTVAIVMR